MTKKQADSQPYLLATERIIDELRRGQEFVFAFAGEHYDVVLPAESIDAGRTAAYAGKPLQLLITPARAQSLGLAGFSGACLLDVTGMSAADILGLADPTRPAAASIPSAKQAAPTHTQLLSLAKQASLLPALLLAENAACGQALKLTQSELAEYFAHPPLEVVKTAGAALPLEGAENTRIISFRSPHGGSVHLAVVVGTPETEDAPLVRVHSACVTGDILGSLRCDCGDQLQMSLEKIITQGSGILLYLHQEGRGIGIVNKLRAYQLQEQGVDTFAANQMLGFDEDERDFAIAGAMLKAFGLSKVRLLTNNPQKIANLEKYGIHTTERIALAAPAGKHNHAYIDAKTKKAGHLF